MVTITPTPRSVEIRTLIEQHREEVEALLRKYGATNVRIFGSVARGDADETSDLDIMFAYPAGMGLVAMSRMERELSELLDVDVDMVPDSALLKTVRPSALTDAVPL